MLNMVTWPSWRRRSEREEQYHARPPLCYTNTFNRPAWGDRTGPARTRAARKLAGLSSLAARQHGPFNCAVNREILLCKRGVTLPC
jgi:hypothetical protein